MMTSHITLIFCSFLSIQSVVVNTEWIHFPKLLASQTKLEFLNLMDIRLELKRFIFMLTQENSENRILEKLRFIRDCEKRIHEADNIDTLKDDFYQMICEYQECYKKAVEEDYKQNPPFSPQTNPEEEIKLFLPQIYDLVTHSIIIGNHELIEKYLIKLVSQKKLSISSEIMDGIACYMEKPEIKGNPINKLYFEWTKKELENLMK